MATCLRLTVDIQAHGCCDGGCEAMLAMLHTGSSTIPAPLTPCARRVAAAPAPWLCSGLMHAHALVTA
jgi:hypothetical protein